MLAEMTEDVGIVLSPTIVRNMVGPPGPAPDCEVDEEELGLELERELKWYCTGTNSLREEKMNFDWASCMTQTPRMVHTDHTQVNQRKWKTEETETETGTELEMIILNNMVRR